MYLFIFLFILTPIYAHTYLAIDNVQRNAMLTNSRDICRDFAESLKSFNSYITMISTNVIVTSAILQSVALVVCLRNSG